MIVAITPSTEPMISQSHTQQTPQSEMKIPIAVAMIPPCKATFQGGPRRQCAAVEMYALIGTAIRNSPASAHQTEQLSVDGPPPAGGQLDTVKLVAGGCE